MWRNKQQPQTDYPVAGRILNRHLRGRPRFRLFQRLKSRFGKLLIPLAIFAFIGLSVWLAHWAGLI